MQSGITKIIIALIALLVVVGGIGAWYFLKTPAPTSNTSQNQTNTVDLNGQNRPVGTGTTVPAEKAPNFDLVYSDIFARLRAEKVQFENVDATTGGAAANVYALYAKDIEIAKDYDSTSNLAISVGAVDVTGDGVPEAIVYENLPGFCGSAGCAMDIYQAQKGRWVKIASFLSGAALGVSAASTNGFKDLYVPMTTAAGQQGIIGFVWDGKAYVSKGAVASWNGSTFVTPK